VIVFPGAPKALPIQSGRDRPGSGPLTPIVASSKAESNLFQTYHSLLVQIEGLLCLLKAKRSFECPVILKVVCYWIQVAIFLLNLGIDVYQGNTGYATAYEIVIGSLGIDLKVDGWVARTAA
jgi:hypothetical protein